MKNFSQFIKETNLALLQAKRLNLAPDGHGGFHNKRTGEFTAKSIGGRLVFFNKRQKIGQQDPRQTERDKRLSYSTYQFTEQELREKYIAKEIFNEGDTVESLINGMVGKIIRRGTNHLICVTENDVMFKSWIKDVKESKKYTEVHMSSVDRELGKPNTLVGTDGYLKNVIEKTPGALDHNLHLIGTGAKQFINKYKRK